MSNAYPEGERGGGKDGRGDWAGVTVEGGSLQTAAGAPSCKRFTLLMVSTYPLDPEAHAWAACGWARGHLACLPADGLFTTSITHAQKQCDASLGSSAGAWARSHTCVQTCTHMHTWSRKHAQFIGRACTCIQTRAHPCRHVHIHAHAYHTHACAVADL